MQDTGGLFVAMRARSAFGVFLDFLVFGLYSNIERLVAALAMQRPRSSMGILVRHFTVYGRFAFLYNRAIKLGLPIIEHFFSLSFIF